jgi:hypothetical protein
MNDADRDPIVAIAVLAALADGTRSAEEQVEIEATAARLFEGVARKVLGGLLGGVVGGATGLAAGAAVTFSTTYALGHVAKQYYAQGRRLDAADLRALFARFQLEAKALLPRVEEQIRAQSQNLDVQSLLGTLRGR